MRSWPSRWSRQAPLPRGTRKSGLAARSYPSAWLQKEPARSVSAVLMTIAPMRIMGRTLPPGHRERVPAASGRPLP
ncbi:hypothetical protein [Ornithinimicrobium kibberense]|uniref:hypothetical protein n=1 Tax=Ornithinimicrobium kibberense TaxID=282060 RepID=UPI0036097359